MENYSIEMESIATIMAATIGAAEAQGRIPKTDSWEAHVEALEKRIEALEHNSHPPMPKDTSNRLEALEARVQELEGLSGPMTVLPDGTWHSATGRTLGYSK